MASTYTDGLAVEIIGSGDKAGSWGDVTNNNLKALEQGIRGFSTIALTGTSTNINLPDGETVSETSGDARIRSSVVRFTGASGNHTVTLQVGGTSTGVKTSFIAINALDSTHSLIIDVGGTDATIPNGYAAHVHINGTTVTNSFANLAVDKIALKNTEIISNEDDNEILIGADKVILGDGIGNVTLESNSSNNLILQSGNDSATASITVASGINANVDITPHGTGEVNISKVDIDDGEIDGTDIGANAVGTGAFSTLSATGTSTLVAINASGNIATSGSTTITAANGLVASAGGATITGNSTIAGTLSSLQGLTLSSGAINVGNGGIINTGSIAGVTTIAANNTIETSGNINTTGSGSITAANGLVVTAGGANLNNSGITNAGSISGLSALSVAGNIDTTSGGNLTVAGTITSTGTLTASGGINSSGILSMGLNAITNATSISGVSGTFSSTVSAATVTGSSSVITPRVTTASAADLLIQPNSDGKVNVTSTNTATGHENPAIKIEATAGWIGLEVGDSNDLITTRVNDIYGLVVQEDGAYIHDNSDGAGNRYLGFGSGVAADTMGIRRNISDTTLEIRDETSGGSWGRPYYSDMRSGGGSYFKSAVNLGDASSGSLPANFAGSVVHSLGSIPKILRAVLKCNHSSGDNGYAQNDEVDLLSLQTDGSGASVSVGADATNVFVGCHDLDSVVLAHKDGSDGTTITKARWDIYVYAWK
ncbi:MAG: hypothetical protein V3V47_03290 [Desulfobacteria bacterium]